MAGHSMSAVRAVRFALSARMVLALYVKAARVHRPLFAGQAGQTVLAFAQAHGLQPQDVNNAERCRALTRAARCKLLAVTGLTETWVAAALEKEASFNGLQKPEGGGGASQ